MIVEQRMMDARKKPAASFSVAPWHFIRNLVATPLRDLATGNERGANDVPMAQQKPVAQNCSTSTRRGKLPAILGERGGQL